MFQLVLQGVPVKRGLLNGHKSYVASISFGDIARLLGGGHLYVPNQQDLPDFAQRKLNSVRIKAIAHYILENYHNGTIFFPPICINVQPSPVYQGGNIILPYHSMTLRLTDGQHRCFGIRQALKEIQTQDSNYFAVLSQLEVGVLIYSALSLEDERQAFRDQNLLVQRPSVSLSHYFDQRSPEVLIAKSLTQKVLYFRDNVEKVENGLSSYNSKLITLSTLVTATRYMFPNLKDKKDFDFKLEWAVKFWDTVASLLPDNPWQSKNKEEQCQQRQDSLLVSSVLFQALGMLAHDLYLEGVNQEELVKWLNSLQEIDWRRSNELWIERGVFQVGAIGEPIISNTKTTVRACYMVLREFVGVSPISGVL
jgi:DNA sulfur modification protein DndB